ncbi:MAG: hypothetical protein E7409_06295 [Ruminococcaceae bacterium]|nr:hypothetical protein [Oscillospiraceae bacterium]
MEFREEKQASKQYKKSYLEGLDHVIALRQQEAAARRLDYIKDVFSEPERYREDLKQMLGWPLTEKKPSTLPHVTQEKLSQEDGYSIWRMGIEILDGCCMSGLFFRADGEEKRPLVIVQHGGGGTPELISGVYGDTSNYNDMLERVRQYGVHVFAPQVLLWDKEYEVEYDRKDVDGRLKRVGSSLTAMEVYGITRILDYFEVQPYVGAFGMVGMSYGGFYTLYTTAIDTRIQSAVSCGFFNSRDAVGWSDWTWHKSAEKFDDAQVACLVYPRRLCIEIANEDALFDYRRGEESFDTLTKACSQVGTDWVELIVFDGFHEFCKQDEPLARLVSDLS